MSDAAPTYSIEALDPSTGPHAGGAPGAGEFARFARAAFEDDRVHSALDALPDPFYGEAIEFCARPTALTQKLSARCKRLAANAVGAGPSGAPGASASPIQSLALPARRFDLIVFTDALAILSDGEVDQLSAYVLATLAPGGHVLLVHWLNGAAERLPGDAAAERLFARVGPTLQPMLRRRTPLYRLDVLERP